MYNPLVALLIALAGSARNLAPVQPASRCRPHSVARPAAQGELDVERQEAVQEGGLAPAHHGHAERIRSSTPGHENPAIFTAKCHADRECGDDTGQTRHGKEGTRTGRVFCFLLALPLRSGLRRCRDAAIVEGERTDLSSATTSLHGPKPRKSRPICASSSAAQPGTTLPRSFAAPAPDCRKPVARSGRTSGGSPHRQLPDQPLILEPKGEARTGARSATIRNSIITR